MVVVPQKTGIRIEPLDKLREYVLTYLSRGGCRGLYQLSGNGSDDEVQAAQRGLLSFGEHVPAGCLAHIRGRQCRVNNTSMSDENPATKAM